MWHGTSYIISREQNKYIALKKKSLKHSLVWCHTQMAYNNFVDGVCLVFVTFTLSDIVFICTQPSNGGNKDFQSNKQRYKVQDCFLIVPQRANENE